jgi:hypothetical protein
MRLESCDNSVRRAVVDDRADRLRLRAALRRESFSRIRVAVEVEGVRRTCGRRVLVKTGSALPVEKTFCVVVGISVKRGSGLQLGEPATQPRPC